MPTGPKKVTQDLREQKESGLAAIMGVLDNHNNHWECLGRFKREIDQESD